MSAAEFTTCDQHTIFLYKKVVLYGDIRPLKLIVREGYNDINVPSSCTPLQKREAMKRGEIREFLPWRKVISVRQGIHTTR